MTDRYLAWVSFQGMLEAVRWSLFGLAAVFAAGYLAMFILPAATRKWAQPMFELSAIVFVYALMVWGQLQK